MVEKASSIDLLHSSSNSLNEASRKKKGHNRSESARDFRTNCNNHEPCLLKGVGPSLADIIKSLKENDSTINSRLEALNLLVSLLQKSINLENYYPLEVIFDM